MKTILPLLLGICVLANGQTAEQIDRAAKLQVALIAEDSAKNAKARNEMQEWGGKQLAEQEFLRMQKEEEKARSTQAQNFDSFHLFTESSKSGILEPLPNTGTKAA